MDKFMDMTKKAGHRPELQRLIDLDAVYDDALGGKLILAPINLEEPGKRILDSGTADGKELPITSPTSFRISERALMLAERHLAPWRAKQALGGAPVLRQ